MINAAFFPTSAETLPIALHINQYSNTYHINTFLTFPGSGLCGRDIGTADNRSPIGVIADNCFSKFSNDWDYLIVVGQLDFYDDDSLTRPLAITVIEEAITMGKTVICSAKLSHDELTHLSAHSDFFNFKYLYKQPEIINYPKNIQLYKPSPDVIFLGGLFYQTNSLEPFLTLYGELSKKYNVFSFSTSMNSVICGIPSIYSILYERSYLEEEKIYAINSFVRTNAERICPDVILIHIAEPLIPYNDKITNGFGVVPFLISKAIHPDFFVCGIPVSYAYTSYVSTLSDGIFNQLGFGIDYVHLSNVVIDTAVSFNEKNITSFTTFEEVYRQKEIGCTDSQIPISNLLDPSNVQDVISLISSDVDNQRNFKLLI